MGIRVILLITIYAILISSCKSPEVLFSDEIKTHSEVYDVKGITGWRMNQSVEYGGYRTSKIRRGWTEDYEESSFILRFQSASEKLQFTQLIPSGQKAAVFAIGEFVSSELEFDDDFFSVEIEEENTFAGTVIPQNGASSWNFIIYDTDGGNLKNTTAGYAVNGVGEKIEIKGVRKMENNKAVSVLFALDIKGYEFYKEGQLIGTVSLIQEGKVRFTNGLDENTQLILSSLMTAVMVRSNLE